MNIHFGPLLFLLFAWGCTAAVPAPPKAALPVTSAPLPMMSMTPTSAPTATMALPSSTPPLPMTTAPIPVPTATPLPSPPPLPNVTVSTLAGHEIPGDKEGLGTEARFFSPAGLAYSNEGALIIADTGNYRLRQMLPSGQVKPFVGSNTTGSTFGDASRVRFTAPVQLVTDKFGYFYLVDKSIPILKKVSPTGFTEAWISSEAFFSMYPQPEFGAPEQLALDAQGNLWVTTDNRLWRITPLGKGTVVLGGANGFPAPLQAISGLAVTPEGTVWLSDSDSHRLFTWQADTGLKEMAGNGPGFADGLGRDARFNNPQGLAIGIDGLVYVADTNNYRIRRITAWGLVQTVAGQGTAGLQDGPGTTARFKQLRAMTWSPTGDLMVSDSSTIRRLQLNP